MIIIIKRTNCAMDPGQWTRPEFWLNLIPFLTLFVVVVNLFNIAYTAAKFICASFECSKVAFSSHPPQRSFSFDFETCLTVSTETGGMTGATLANSSVALFSPHSATLRLNWQTFIAKITRQQSLNLSPLFSLLLSNVFSFCQYKTNGCTPYAAVDVLIV